MKRALYLTGVFSFFILCSTSCPEKEINVPPECSISSPDNGSEFFVGDTVEIIVDVWDENFHTTLVAYYANGAEIGVDEWVAWTSTFNWDTEGFGFDRYDIGITVTDWHGGSCGDEITIVLKQKTASTD